MTHRYRVVLFDLFGTLVHFAAAGERQRTFEWLRDPLAAHYPAVDFDTFRRAVFDVSAEMMAARAADHRETPSRERFRRALHRLDAPAADAHLAGADALSLAHMAHLAALTEMPAAHGELLRELAGRYRLGLVSNFDHAPTARAILGLHGVRDCFAVIVISDDFGLRKPHPDIFHTALGALDAAPGEALYVGDTAADDVIGSQAIGLDVAWINRRDEPPPQPPPTYTLRSLIELRQIL